MTIDSVVHLVIESGPNWLSSLSFFPLCLAWLGLGSLALLIFALIAKHSDVKIDSGTAIMFVAGGYITLMIELVMIPTFLVMLAAVGCLYVCAQGVSWLTGLKFDQR